MELLTAEGSPTTRELVRQPVLLFVAICFFGVRCASPARSAAIDADGSDPASRT